MSETAMPEIEISRDGKVITLHVPIALRRIGGRKMVVSPDGEQPWAPPGPKVDGPLVNAIARAFRWKDMLDAGRYATVEELAKAEGMNASFLARVLRLTLLAPDIVEAILDGRQPATLQLQPLIRKGVPLEWGEQRSAIYKC